MGWIIRSFGACVGLLIAACLSPAIAQPTSEDDSLRFQIGRDVIPGSVREQSGHYLPYALFAVSAYDEKLGRHNRKPRKALDEFDAATRTIFTSQREQDAVLKNKARWMAGWRQVPAIGIQENFAACRTLQGGPCDPGWQYPLAGLGYSVFVNQSCTEAVIAFRGTNFDSASDWLSNLRWMTRILPLYDQYEQVRASMPWITKMTRDHCRNDRIRLIAVGHSLGGGLAQQAAYESGQIKRVFAFDPSVVTGYYSTSGDRKAKAVGIETDRIYEHGEVLAYLRNAIEQVYPQSTCNPQVRKARHNLLKGNPLQQHSMIDFTVHLVHAVGPPSRWKAKAKPLPGPSPLACHTAEAGYGSAAFAWRGN